MTFWQHLEELRGVLLRVLAVLALFATVLFFIMPWLFHNVILWPCRPDFPLYSMLGFIKGDGEWLPDMSDTSFSVALINIKLGTQLLTHFSASFYLALVLAFPVVIWLLWRFVSPALYENERRGSRKAFIFGNVMFYLGIAMGYFIIFPLALRFLTSYQLSPTISNSLTLDSYMESFYSTILAMGIVFEIPLLAWMLGKMGFLRRSFFSRYRRHAIVALAALAGIITPTSDLFTLAVAFIPLYMLWEFSARLVPPAHDSDNNSENTQTTPAP